MNEDFKHRLGDYFTPAELVELLDIDTYDVVSALDDFNGFELFSESVIEDLTEIMDHGK